MSTDDSSPLNAKDTTVITNGAESYGTMLSIQESKIKYKYRELNNCDIFILTLILWNVYLCRKILYPFTKEFAEFYNLSITSFSFILSAFNIGGATSICLALFPSLHHIRIHLMFFLITFTLAVLYFLLSYCYTFIALFVVRMIMGFICTTLVAEMRGILSIFTKETSQIKSTSDDEKSVHNDTKLTFRVLLTESSWFTSSAGWIIVGVILNRLNVIYVWYFGCICAVFVSLLCYFLPSFTVSHVLSIKSKVQSIENDNNIQNLNGQSLLKQYHLFFLLFGSIFFNLAYSAFLATFGPWMQIKFHLNAEQLGFQTIFISMAELVALLTTTYASKYKSNMWLSIFSAFIAVITALVFVIGLSLHIVNEIFVWIILFVFTMFIEYTFLNIIVANLLMTPHGLESKSSLILQTAQKASLVIGLILGPHINKWHGFETVMQYILGSQLIALILFWIANKQFQRHKNNKNNKTNLEDNV